MTISPFCIYDLFYYERGSKETTRCVESFQFKSELLERMAELKAMPGKDFVFPDWDNIE
ncbi:MAG: hypothetical protein GX488_04570 [Clostridiales bacterium]|nr:hypothetical protein [Clostridiales bacterium]